VTFGSGDTVVVQEVWDGRVWAARPMTVVEDAVFVGLWFPKGTVWKRPVTPPDRAHEPDRGKRHAGLLMRGDWIFVDSCWDVSTLVLMWADEWHATWVSWLDDGVQWGWYVNLQKPFRRTRLGFETMDLTLDVLIENDRVWRWKDEDELESFVAVGVYDRALVERLREEGRRVVVRAGRNEWPFDQAWASWQPAPSSPLPVLPDGWDEPCR
jgi:Protein of unknown function (DUF402)